jgi:Na+-transporting methylmalonyl-CoA/oxaloacetate decarboxylase gamma subunit
MAPTIVAMNGLAIVFPVLLLLVAVITQLAALGVISRNRIVGIRIRSS